MNEDWRTFFKSYLPALREAIANDHINLGFLVKGPEWYLDEPTRKKAEKLAGMPGVFDHLFSMVDIYFDAKSHGFPNIDDEDVDEYRSKLRDEITRIERQFNLK
jgi:hypothetical protein